MLPEHPGTIAGARSLCEVFQATALRRPDAVALRSNDGATAITWRQYAERVRELAAGFAALGVRHGDSVAIMLSNRPEFNLIDTALLHLGATSFSVYNTYPAEQIAQLFSEAGNRIVITEPQFLDRVRDATERAGIDTVVCLDGDGTSGPNLDDVVALGRADFDFEQRWRAVTPDDVATLIFTSGTTGAPKGVELTHRNLLFSVGSNVELQAEFARDDRCAHVVSYLPDANLANRWSAHYVPLASGALVTTVRDGRNVIPALADLHPTAFMGVPMIWYKLKDRIEAALAERPAAERKAVESALELGTRMARAEVAGVDPDAALAADHAAADAEILAPLRREFGLDRFWVTTSGGAPIAPEVLEFFMALGVPLCEVWGMTEVAASGLANNPGSRRPGTVGRPRAGVEIRRAEDGELLVRSPGVMRGYRNSPEKTADALDADGWLYTGDVATIDDEGYVRIVDRKKDMIINSSGKNMSPANIENTVRLHCPLAGTVVAIGDARPHVTALITLDPEAARAFAADHGLADDPQTLATDPLVLAAVGDGVERANERLPRVEHVRAFTILPAFWDATSEELTATTKVRRPVVTAKYADRISAMYAR